MSTLSRLKSTHEILYSTLLLIASFYSVAQQKQAEINWNVIDFDNDGFTENKGFYNFPLNEPIAYHARYNLHVFSFVNIPLQ